jgi:hypothetical protein
MLSKPKIFVSVPNINPVNPERSLILRSPNWQFGRTKLKLGLRPKYLSEKQIVNLL